MKTWLEIPEHSDFSIYNIPFGIAQIDFSVPVVCTRIADYVLDLSWLAKMGYFDNIVLDPKVFHQPYLNAFMALGKETTNAVRHRIQDILCEETERNVVSFGLNDLCDVDVLMPVYVGDYTEFFCCESHAINIGKICGDSKSTPSSWKYFPIGYHGRTSSIMATGAEIHRPNGLIIKKEDETPVVKPSEMLDFELEMAFVTRKSTALGNTISINEAEDYIFGFLLFNDLAAHDIESCGSHLTGTFAPKSFASVVSPWVVTIEALEDFRSEGPKQNPEPLPHLKSTNPNHFDINLEIFLQSEDGTETLISQTNYNQLYWSITQLLTHQSTNGTNIQVGDLYTSGTISGEKQGSYGSLFELSWNGAVPIELENGQKRSFLQDGDTVIFRGYAKNNEKRIGFGEAKVKILPAK